MAFKVVVLFALIGISLAEPPSSGYNYNVPSVELGRINGFNSHSLSSSYRSADLSAAELVDGRLLAQIQQLLLQDEIRAHSAHISAPSGAYGVPQDSYGPPSARYQQVVGVLLEQPQHSIPITEFSEQISAKSGGYNYAPASSYGVPAF